MPLASASFAPVSTVPWELKGREEVCEDVCVGWGGGAENGHLMNENNSQQPKDHLSFLPWLPLCPRDLGEL